MRGANTVEYLEAKIVEQYEACLPWLQRWRAGDKSAAKPLRNEAAGLYMLVFAASLRRDVLRPGLLTSLEAFGKLTALGGVDEDKVARRGALRQLKR